MPRIFNWGALAAILFFVSPLSSDAQGVEYSVSNEFRYGIGKQYENDVEGTKEYLEDLLNTRIFFNDFRVGFRVQLDRPREFGPDTVGLTEYFAEFDKDGITARAGTFHEKIGNGLVMNTFESRPVGFNTLTEGVNIDYEREEFSAGAFGGDMKYADIIVTNRVESYLLRGAWTEIRPINEVAVGASFLAATGRKERGGFGSEFDAYLREWYAEAYIGPFTAVYNWADKRTALDSLTKEFTNSTRYGTGWYSKLQYSGSLFSILGEYKDYRFDLLDPTERDISSRVTRALPFQNAPTLIPEHDKTLLGRNPHTIDYSDEIGAQLTGFIYPTENIIIQLLATAASRHRGFNASKFTDSTGLESIAYQAVQEKPLVFPELSDDRYSPYWEIFAEADYQVSDRLNTKVAFQRKENTIYIDPHQVEILDPELEVYEATTVVLDATYNVTRRSSLHGILEAQQVYESQKVGEANDSLGFAASDGRFTNALLTLEYSRSPHWSVNARLEWTSTDREQNGRRIWPVVGGTYRIGKSHTIGAQYGYERGGIVCTGGVCRFINPFTGLRLTLVSTLP